TQVFLSPNDDHICTRMEHVLHVSSIASVIGRCLNLNIDLINAIARGHDLGHPPFGHAGERVLNALLEREGDKHGFMHEVHGLRVVDKLTNYGAGLNLTYEVRDGIVTHCGEKFERRIVPDRTRDLANLDRINDRTYYPSTLEGCCVRMVDRIAYLGRDLEDGVKAGFVKKSEIPQSIARKLGTDNGKIIGRFVNDAIENSVGKDAIELSGEVFDLMDQLKEFNYEKIYTHPEVLRKANKSDKVLEHLFYELLKILEDTERGNDLKLANDFVKGAPTLRVLFNFIKNTNYTEKTPVRRMVTDYIAGMTDIFAQRTYAELFMPTPVV
ncbi:MAG: HD domain-containing protein, partial [Chitinivibrionales bacterium]|nr:HD domain-containing protein [Chitinivibrionales bacterium]